MTQRVEAGTALATRADGSIAKVTANISEVANLAKEVSDATAQQRDSVEHMKQALLQLDNVTQQNASLVNEANNTASALNQEAQRLETTLAAFHLDRQDARAQAMSMVRRAVAHIRNNGREKALRDLSDPNGPFVNGEFYVAVNDRSGLCVAHGTMRHLIGQSHWDLKDADGKFFVREYLRIASNQGQGWLDYRWLNSATKQVQEKSGYVERVGDLVVSCGIDKESNSDAIHPRAATPRLTAEGVLPLRALREL